MPQHVYEDFIVDIADDQLNKYRVVNSDEHRLHADESVEIIATFLKKRTREIDLKLRHITYNQLDTILGKFGLCLKSPKGNHIDVVRERDRDTLDLLEKPYR